MADQKQPQEAEMTVNDLERVRAALDVPWKELANRLGTAPNTITKYAHGRGGRIPHRIKLGCIALLTGVTLEDALQSSDREMPATGAQTYTGKPGRPSGLKD